MLRNHPPIGLTLVRPPEIMGAEPYFHELIAGIERITLPEGFPVFLRVLQSHQAELDAYRAWAKDGLVSALLIVDVREDDERPSLVQELGLPAVVAGPPGFDALTTVWTDDDEAMRRAVRRLSDLGHTTILHIGGPGELEHSRRRRTAFAMECASLGVNAHVRAGDYSRGSGAAALLDAIETSAAGSAVICDSDVMALGALDQARTAGLEVPGEISIVAWDDSALCQLAAPALSAVARDIQSDGRLVGTALLEAMSGAQPRVIIAPPAILIERASMDRPHRGQKDK